MNKNISSHVKLSFRNNSGESFMGIGLIWLLERIDTFKSIRRAAEDMKMSYMKATKIINRLEENIGERLLIRTIGGNSKGGSELTPFAKKYIAEYKQLSDSLAEYMEKEFKNFLKKFS